MSGILPRRILVTSTVPDAVNTNSAIRRFLTDGFREALGDAAVRASPLEYAAEAIAGFGPALVVAVGSLAVDDADLRALGFASRKAGATLAFWLHDDPYEFDYAFKANGIADHVFSNDRWAVPHYRHPSVSHLPMAGSPATHLRPVRPFDQREIDLFFCGVAFANRIDLVSRMMPGLAGRRIEILGADWPITLPVARNERLTAAEMSDRTTHARLTLNVGRTLDIANARFNLPPSTPGPRTFETALAGSPQLFFCSGLEICDYFDEAEEIVLFDEIGEIGEAIARSHREPAVLEGIAMRAQRRALDHHTYRHRAETILSTLSGV